MRESWKLLSEALHLPILQGAGEARSEAYCPYVERVLQPATQQKGKNLARAQALTVFGRRCKGL